MAWKIGSITLSITEINEREKNNNGIKQCESNKLFYNMILFIEHF